MKIRIAIVVVFLVLAGVLLWEFVIPSGGAPLVAQVGSERITVSEFDEAMKLRGATPDEAGIEALLEEMISRKALVARARAQGIDRDPAVLREIENILIGRLKEKHGQFDQVAEPDEAALKESYQDRLEEFRSPARRQLAILFVAKSSFGSGGEGARSRVEELKGLLEESGAPADRFQKLVAQFSDHRESRYRGGDIGWFHRGQAHRFSQAVIDAGFQLEKPGEISAPVETEEGMTWVKLLGNEPESVKPFESVRQQLRHQWLLEERRRLRDRFEEDSRAAVAIEIYRDHLPEPSAGPGEGGDGSPPGLPGS